MLKKISAGTIGILSFMAANAQDTTKTAPPAPTTTFTYSVDGYYRADFAGQLSNNKTSFTNSNNSFELGMASVKVDHSFGKVSAEELTNFRTTMPAPCKASNKLILVTHHLQKLNLPSVNGQHILVMNYWMLMPIEIIV